MKPDELQEIHHPDGTIEWLSSDGKIRIRIPEKARVTEDELRDCLGDEEVLTAIFGEKTIQKAKDVDLAHKVIDSAKVSGLTNAERSRLFDLLTGGGEWEGKKHNEKSEAVRDLKLALELEHVTGAKRHRLIRERTGKYKSHCTKANEATGKNKPTTNINKYDAHLKALLQQVENYHREDIEMILNDAIEGGYKLSIDGIIHQIESTRSLLEAFPEALKQMTTKKH